MSFYQPVAPAGSNTQIQYNKNGGFGGDADLTWDDSGKELGVGGDINLDDGGTYTTTVQVVTPTANRTISFPDATGTVGLVAGSSGQLAYNNAGAYAGLSTVTTDGTDVTLTGRFISSLNGAASAPPGTFTGTWFTGGTSTTTKPQVLIEPTGTTSTAWSTDGTGLGVNAASGFTGRLLDLQTNGTSRMVVQGDGKVLVGTSTSTEVASSVPAIQQIRYSSSNLGLSLVRDGAAPTFALARTASAPYGLVSSGDLLGNIRWAGADGTDIQSIAAEIGCEVDGTPGANDMPGRLVFSTTPDASATPTERLRITSAGVLQVADAGNIAVGTTTGTKIGTATTQKLGFYNQTPVVQPTAVADATDAASAITQLNALLSRMRDLGLIAT